MVLGSSFVELLDWLGRIEIIEKHLPKWALFIMTAQFNLAVILVGLAFLWKWKAVKEQDPVEPHGPALVTWIKWVREKPMSSLIGMMICGALLGAILWLGLRIATSQATAQDSKTVDAKLQGQPSNQKDEGNKKDAPTPHKQNEKPKTPPQVTQESHGDNSPNTTIVGDNNTVINGDLKISAKLDEIKELLQAQQGQNVTPKELLKKYAFGYVIFDVDYQNSVFPYQNKALDNWEFDWKVVKIVKLGDHGLQVRLPDMRNKIGGQYLRDYETTIPQKLGRFPQITMRDAESNMDLVGEVLAITDKGVVFLLGFKPTPPKDSN